MLASNISKPVASSSSNTNYGGKKPLPSSSCWVWEGWWGTLCSLTLNQQDERYWSSHDTALLGQETTSGLFPGFCWVPIPTVSAVALLHQDDHGFPGTYNRAKLTLPDWLHVLYMSGSHHATPRPLKVNKLMHNGLRREKLHWRFQQPLHASVYSSKLSYSMISMCLHVSCHTFKEDKQAQSARSPQNFCFTASSSATKSIY